MQKKNWFFCQHFVDNRKHRARKLYCQVLTKPYGCIWMDEETYMKADCKEIPGVKYYKADARGSVHAF